MVSRRRFLEQAGVIAGAAALGAQVLDVDAALASSRQVADQLSQPRFEARAERAWIPMRDGVELAATLVVPDGAPPGSKFPALFGYDPYRGAERLSSGGRPGYFAERGYVSARVNVRGTGASPGRTVPNEYSVQEAEDADDVIAWLAEQPWCSGNVGMFGGSYGGFNSIQTAMRRPPALKAIIPIHATDDVYTDDIVYYDGALQFDSLGRWPFSMIAGMGLPAAPDNDTETEEARYRVEHEPWIFEMLRQQQNTPFWQRMSLRPHYDRIEIPTLMIGGWLDAYTDSIPRMLEYMNAPMRAVIGPWTHAIGRPGPGFDAGHEMLRWWDQWLKGIDTGVTREPKVAIYINHSYKPSLTIAEIPGEWHSEENLPVARVQEHTWHPRADGLLARQPGGRMTEDLEYKPTVGMTNRYRCPHNSAELPIDQRTDDVFGMSFTSEPLDEDIEIVGFPRALLHVSATAPVANWIVRLCDVWPDGTSTLVTKGILNGTQRRSNATPEPLVPGEVYELAFNLKVISWVFPKGHRLRFVVSNADFPNLWPTPYAMTTTLHVSPALPSQFLLPVCPPADRPLPNINREEGPPASRETGTSANQWQVIRDEMAQNVTVFRETKGGRGFERRWCTASDVDPGQSQDRRGGHGPAPAW